MKRALVTGGCGFLGSALVRELLAEGVDVRVLALPREPTDNLDGLDVEILRGNVLDIDDCKRAVEGQDSVFHVAAVYKADMVDPTPMYEVNNKGTFHVFEACRRGGVEKLVYTASIVSLGRPPLGAVGDETTPYEAWSLDFHYSRSKYHSREIADCFAEWGQDVRVVCPALVVGPGDIAPTPSGKLIINTIKTKGPGVYTEGGTAYVDVRDAAKVHVLAAQKGKAGERYIAAGHNLSNQEYVQSVLAAVGRKKKLMRLSTPIATRLVRGVERLSKRMGKEPPVTSTFFEYSLQPAFYSNRKSIEELGATYRPFGETVSDAVKYFEERGLLRH